MHFGSPEQELPYSLLWIQTYRHNTLHKSTNKLCVVDHCQESVVNANTMTKLTAKVGGGTLHSVTWGRASGSKKPEEARASVLQWHRRQCSAMLCCVSAFHCAASLSMSVHGLLGPSITHVLWFLALQSIDWEFVAYRFKIRKNSS